MMRTKKIHYLQHVPFEDPANIIVWAKEKGYEVSGTLMFEKFKLPDIAYFDWLVIMGGPMGVYDEDKYSWLNQEKEFIKKAIRGRKKVLGVCLGAQLIADALGAKVVKNQYKEIGWYPVSLTREAEKFNILEGFPKKFLAFHWHGDMFEIPDGALRIAQSKGCKNQAFEYAKGRVLALQFHLESGRESVKKLITNCRDELTEGKYIQKAEEIINQKKGYETTENLIFGLLNNMDKFV